MIGYSFLMNSINYEGTVSWVITKDCNAVPVCWYCITKMGTDAGQGIIPFKTIELIAKKIGKLSGCKIFINGGEPFIIPSFSELIVPHLIVNKNLLFVTSNFLNPINDYLAFIDLFYDSIYKLNLSYHAHLFLSPDVFLNKLDQLIISKKNEEKIQVSGLLMPGKLEELAYLDKRVKQRYNISLYPQHLKLYDIKSNIRLPYNYSEEQQAYIDEKFGYKRKKERGYPVGSKGVKCSAGTKYLFIMDNGDVYPCQMSYYEKPYNPICNLVDSEMHFFDNTITCGFDYCGCGSAQNLAIIE